MKKEYTTHSSQETKNIAKEFAQSLRGGEVLLLSGDLGSGKTTFAQGVLETLGAEKPYTSPTFVIMKTYSLEKTSREDIQKIHHIDTYRIESKDILDLGWNEMTQDTNSVILLEWPERIQEILPDHAQIIQFSHAGENVRTITFV